MKDLRDLINILALPNMGDEGRKAKLIAIKAWQIEFLNALEELRQAEIENWNTASAMATDAESRDEQLSHATGRIRLINQILRQSFTLSEEAERKEA